jgi:lipoprotein signal peptidase
MQANLKSRFSYIILVVLVLISDRISKSSIVSHFDLGQPAPVIDGLFNITYVQNTGVAFGILNAFSSPAKVFFLGLVAGIAAIVVIIYSLRNDPRNRMLQGALALVLAGALGNLYDRIRFGYVVDFLEFHARGYYWPSFNIADMSITIGVILLAWEMFHNEAPGRA